MSTYRRVVFVPSECCANRKSAALALGTQERAAAGLSRTWNQMAAAKNSQRQRLFPSGHLSSHFRLVVRSIQRWSEDVLEDVALKIVWRVGRASDELSSSLGSFVDRHLGSDVSQFEIVESFDPPQAKLRPFRPHAPVHCG
jgi:hypothetical protein